jgi:hypothetical protein
LTLDIKTYFNDDFNLMTWLCLIHLFRRVTNLSTLTVQSLKAKKIVNYFQWFTYDYRYIRYIKKGKLIFVFFIWPQTEIFCIMIWLSTFPVCKQCFPINTFFSSLSIFV